jgi:outer membrane scaffolding protein for murein synthesis (MipA/OmpV family)
MSNRLPFAARAALCLTLASLAPSAFAQPPNRAPQGWAVSVGGGLVSGPASLGSTELQFIPVPAFDVRYKDWFYANPGLGIGVQGRSGGLRAYGGLGVDFNNRDPSVDPALAGLNRVPSTAAIRTGLEYSVSRINLGLDITSRLGNAERLGTQAVLEVGTARPLDFKNPRTIVGGGAFATLMDDRFANNLVSVTAAESARSGLPEFDVGAGLLDVGLRARIIHRFSERWNLFSQFSISQLQGDAADSPVAQTQTQLGFLAFVQYQLRPR